MIAKKFKKIKNKFWDMIMYNYNSYWCINVKSL